LSYEDKQKVKQFLFGKGYSVEAQLAMLGFLKNWFWLIDVPVY
jgi:hypothetical protein